MPSATGARPLSEMTTGSSAGRRVVPSFSNILRQGQSEVINGNLLTLPVGGGLLYVQPVFVQSSGATKLPTLQKVLVGFGDQVAFEDTLQAALDKLFGGDSGASTGDTDVVPEPSPGDEATPGTGDGGTAPTTPAADYQAALNQARDALAERNTAMQNADWAAYGAADAKLTEAISRLLELGEQGQN